MCGIAGIAFNPSEDHIHQDNLIRMRDIMTHRGPDDAGLYIGNGIGMCHRRLSIIGVSTGHQPMPDSSNRYQIVFNGEIYNYRDLRSSLEKLGYSFRTQSDTEVIINAYAHYGEQCVDYFNGMFAFAIWDTESKALFIARDRLGVKPLYYFYSKNKLVFASEIKVLFESGHVQAKMDQTSAYEYFVFRGVSGSKTLFSNVKSLPPGHLMRFADGHCTIRSYWSHHNSNYPIKCSFDESVEELHTILKDAVRIRLMSEVPLGTFCSGGVDSSLVTAMAASELGPGVNTFSVGFSDSAYDETQYARIVSARYRTQHHELIVENTDFSKQLEDLIWLNDEPLHFANSVQIYAISKLAKEFVTVVLTGEGADELFLGYPRYHIPYILNKLKSVAFVISPLLRAGHSVIHDHRLLKLASFMNRSSDDAILFNIAVNDMDDYAGLLDCALDKDLSYRRDVLRKYNNIRDIGVRLSLQDQQTYLVSILNRQDKMSMGASIEARVPFLDYRVAEFANVRPSSCRTHRFKGKELVKQVAKRYLPNEVVYRKKSGFGVPLNHWFKSDTGIGALATQYFNEGRVDDVIDRKRLLDLLSNHKAGVSDNSDILWTALNFIIWRDRYHV